jgi:hypothetical protein
MAWYELMLLTGYHHPWSIRPERILTWWIWIQAWNGYRIQILPDRGWLEKRFLHAIGGAWTCQIWPWFIDRSDQKGVVTGGFSSVKIVELSAELLGRNHKTKPGLTNVVSGGSDSVSEFRSLIHEYNYNSGKKQRLTPRGPIPRSPTRTCVEMWLADDITR